MLRQYPILVFVISTGLMHPSGLRVIGAGTLLYKLAHDVKVER